MGNLISKLGLEGNEPGSLEEKAEEHRRLANELGVKQRELSARSQAAYHAGNGALAKDLSLQAKALHTRVELHNKEASKFHYEVHNASCPAGTIDLHGLHVKEALARLDTFTADARKEQRSVIIVIVGAGNHSEGGVQRIRPAVEKWCRERGHRFDEVNHGCVRVFLKEKRSFCCIM